MLYSINIIYLILFIYYYLCLISRPNTFRNHPSINQKLNHIYSKIRLCKPSPKIEKARTPGTSYLYESK